MPTCPHCSSASPSGDPAGVDACPSCGATRVWPPRASAGHSSISEAELQIQLKRAALRYGVMPWTVPLLVESQQNLGRIYTRACWTIERRVATLRMLAVARSEQQKPVAPPDPSAIDIWANEPKAVRLQTECITGCPNCRGTGRTTCPRCGGTCRVRCDQCGGDGQVRQEERGTIQGPDLTVQTVTMTRTVQCLSCRGSGKVHCDSCTNGKVVCIQCDGSTVVEAWIEVSVEQVGQVRVEAGFDVEAMHPAVALSGDFDTPVEQLPAELIADTGWQLPDGFTNCPEPLKYRLDPRQDRLRGVRVQQLRARAVQVTLATRTGHEQIEFVGRPAQLVSGPIRVLGQRAWLSYGIGVAALALGFAAVGYYIERSPWFVAHGRSETLAMLAVLAGGLVGAVMLGVTLPRSRGSALRWGVPLSGLLLTLALAVRTWAAVEPSVVTARAAIERGDFGRVEEELQALAELERDATGITEVRAELRAAQGHEADLERLARFDAADDLDDAAAILRESWFDETLRDEQITAHSKRARTAIDDAWKESRADDLEQLVIALRGLDRTLAGEAKTLADLLAVRAAIGREEFVLARAALDAIESTDAIADERSILATELHEAIATAARRDYALGLDVARSDADRAASLAAFEALATLYEQITGKSPSDVDREQATAIAKKLAKAIEKARVARERTQRRKHEAAMRKPGNAVICNDGTTSDSCTCGERLTGDCCSSHGGVAGCG